MIKILSSADWHVNLHKKKIPSSWQMQRFQMLFQKLHKLEQECDVHVISGDLFDKEPEPDEVCLLLSYLNTVTIPTIIIPGNHEATTKGSSFWEYFKLENTVTNPLVHIFTENSRIDIKDVSFALFPYGSVQTNNLPVYIENDILVTHIRGEVPPHITAEYDFEKLRPWKLILLGDLHANHKYKDFPAYYPGSPINTTFDRDDRRKYGVDVITLNSIDDYSVKFIDLKLPKLIRRTITVDEPMTSDKYHHVIYEVKGSIDQLAKVVKNDLLDKKMIEKDVSESVLNLKDKTTLEELQIYLEYINVSSIDAVLDTYKDLGLQ